MENSNGNCAEQINPAGIAGLKPTGTQTVKVKLYDFKRPDKFSLDQIRTVAIMHENVARLLTAHLSTTLRMLLKINLASVDQLTFEEFINSLPDPAWLGAISMNPLKGSAILEIDPAITYTIIDRILGGDGQTPDITRSHTPFELGILRELYTSGIYKSLAESWSTVIPLQPGLLVTETHPRFAQIVPPTEMVILVSLEATIGEKTGHLNLCIPFLTIEPILHKLTARYWYSMVRKNPDDTARSLAPDLQVACEFFYPTAPLSLSEIDAVCRGNPVKLVSYREGTAFLEAGGIPVLEFRRQAEGFNVITTREDDFTELPGNSNSQEPSPLQLMQQQMSEFKDELKSFLTGIEGQLSSWQQKQEELTDQLLLGLHTPELPQPVSRQSTRPFAFIRKEDSNDLFLLIRQEHPQLAAFILSYLEPSLASQVLAQFPAQQQTDIIKRIANLDRVHQGVTRETENFFGKKLQEMTNQQVIYTTGGIQAVVNILNHSARSVEKNVVETLEQENPGLAEGIKQRMFVFEDIVILDKKALAGVIANSNQQDLALAVKMTPDEVRQYIFAAMDEQELASLKNRINELGRIKIADVEAAQQRIVLTIRAMEENGLIVVARMDELVE